MSYVPLIKKVSDTSQSSLEKYQDLFVGSRSIRELIKYEMLISFLQFFPGAVGIYLRSKAYPRLFKRCGKNVFWGRGVTIRVPGRIELGTSVIIDDNAVLDAKGNPGTSFIRCGNDVEISRNAVLSCKEDGSISLGDFVTIGRHALLSSRSQLIIHDNCSIGPFSCVLASGHGWTDPDTPVMLQDREIKDIVLEENVWLGAHVVLMDGVTVGKNSIIAAGSVVTHDIPPYRIAGGTPARILARRETKSEREYLTDVEIVSLEGVQSTIPEHEIYGQMGEGQLDESALGVFSRATHVVFSALDEVNQQLPSGKRLEKSMDTVLFDGPANQSTILDSLGLLNLIVTTEQKVEAEFGVTINLADEGSMSQKDSPFRSVRSLVNHVSTLLDNDKNERI